MIVFLKHSDILGAMEEFMADVGNGLKIRYGLRNNPTFQQAQEWARITRNLIERGYTKENAGDLAAKQMFMDYRTHVYASEGDTLEMLLQQAGGK